MDRFRAQVLLAVIGGQAVGPAFVGKALGTIADGEAIDSDSY